MAESTLSYDWDDFQNETGRFLGYGATQGSWSSDQEAVVQMCVLSGVRQVMFPPAVQGVRPGYSWSWMRPTTTIDTTADQGTDDMPDDFHRMISGFHFASGKGYRDIKIVPEGMIHERFSMDNFSGFPRLCAFRYKANTGITGQRQEVLWYPTPDAAYTLTYSYEVYTGVLSDSYKYPPGGMYLSELYLESCLAIAEQRIHRQKGLHSSLFEALLLDRVERDKQRGGKNYGRVGHYETTSKRRFRGQNGSSYDLVYNGTPL